MTPLALKFDSRQTHAITPRMQHAVRLLQLSALDYEQELHEMSNRNPFLEVEDTLSAPAGMQRDVPPEPADRPVDPHAADLGGDRPDADTHEWEPDSWVSSPPRTGAREGQATPLDFMVAATDVRQHLRAQTDHLRVSQRTRVLVCSIIESLDDDGYLRTSLDEIGTFSGLEPAPDSPELESALQLVQSLDLAGCGARSVAECLLLQLSKIEPDVRPLAQHIVMEHIDRLAERDVAGIAKRLRQPVEAVDAACAALRRLDPRPGWSLASADTPYVTPDVTVRKVRGRWVAQLNRTVIPRLRLNRGCADLFLRHREPVHRELGAHLQEARWALRNVEQRFSTILAVAEAILRRQVLFFDYGPLAMKPLALRDIAREVGVHESTVCRATNNKFMATPSGLVEMKKFFSRSMPMASGGACSATAIRGVVQELIEAEDPAAPFSDVELTQQLAKQGLVVARRTITKYRQSMKIAPADRRRRSQAGAPGTMPNSAASSA